MFFGFLPSYWADPGSDLKQVSNKTLKTIGPPDNPKDNFAHRVHIIVSPKIGFMGDFNTQMFAV
jgi:hypothetical protein